MGGGGSAAAISPGRKATSGTSLLPTALLGVNAQWVCHKMTYFLCLQCLHRTLQGVPYLCDSCGRRHIGWRTEKFGRWRQQPGGFQSHPQGKKGQSFYFWGQPWNKSNSFSLMTVGRSFNRVVNPHTVNRIYTVPCTYSILVWLVIRRLGVVLVLKGQFKTRSACWQQASQHCCYLNKITLLGFQFSPNRKCFQCWQETGTSWSMGWLLGFAASPHISLSERDTRKERSALLPATTTHT